MADFRVYLGWARLLDTDPSGLAAVRELGRALDLAEVWHGDQGRLYLESPAEGATLLVQSESPAAAALAAALRTALSGTGATVVEAAPHGSRGVALAICLREADGSVVAAHFAGVLNRRSRQLARELLETINETTRLPIGEAEPVQPGDPPLPVTRSPAVRLLIPQGILDLPEHQEALAEALTRGVLRFLCPPDLDRLLRRWAHLHAPDLPGFERSGLAPGDPQAGPAAQPPSLAAALPAGPAAQPPSLAAALPAGPAAQPPSPAAALPAAVAAPAAGEATPTNRPGQASPRVMVAGHRPGVGVLAPGAPRHPFRLPRRAEGPPAPCTTAESIPAPAAVPQRPEPEPPWLPAAPAVEEPPQLPNTPAAAEPPQHPSAPAAAEPPQHPSAPAAAEPPQHPSAPAAAEPPQHPSPPAADGPPPLPATAPPGDPRKAPAGPALPPVAGFPGRPQPLPAAGPLPLPLAPLAGGEDPPAPPRPPQRRQPYRHWVSSSG